jgi:flagellar motor switch protein FliN/FliY
MTARTAVMKRMPEQPRQEDIDELMKVLAGTNPSPASPRKDPPPRPAAAPMAFEPLAAGPAPAHPDAGMDFLSNVEVQVRVELGSSKMNVQEVLKLSSGSVVALDRLVGEPVSVYVNDRLVARGDVLVVHDNLAVRITEVLSLPKSGE